MGLAGKKYLDFTMVGVGSCVLGYSDDDIDRIARKIISSGPLTTLNPPEEIELLKCCLIFISGLIKLNLQELVEK